MKFQISQIIGIIGALCVIVGAFLPWATWSSIAVAGVEGDGRITLFLGFITGALLLWSPRGKKKASFLILGLIISLIGCYDAYDVSKGVVPGVKPNIGIGLFATIIGGLIIVISGIVCLMKIISPDNRKNRYKPVLEQVSSNGFPYQINDFEKRGRIQLVSDNSRLVF